MDSVEGQRLFAFCLSLEQLADRDLLRSPPGGACWTRGEWLDFSLALPWNVGVDRRCTPTLAATLCRLARAIWLRVSVSVRFAARREPRVCRRTLVRAVADRARTLMDDQQQIDEGVAGARASSVIKFTFSFAQTAAITSAGELGRDLATRHKTATSVGCSGGRGRIASQQSRSVA